ncbi:MAG: hypothetical protein QOE37_1456 [Microbacteriaceae bacterium]|nr:hypothetical protein [Microbacteriaceae bacterium]
MKLISYADSSIRTDDRLADTVLEYAKLLAYLKTADTVTIPYLAESGDLAEITMLVGPSSQVTASSDDEHAFPGDSLPAIEEIERRILLRTPRNVAVQERLPEDELDDDEFDAFGA